MSIEKQAMSLPEFCEAYGIGLSKTYEEAAAGRLIIRKVGKRSLITRPDADQWLANLPVQDLSSAA